MSAMEAYYNSCYIRLQSIEDGSWPLSAFPSLAVQYKVGEGLVFLLMYNDVISNCSKRKANVMFNQLNV